MKHVANDELSSHGLAIPGLVMMRRLVMPWQSFTSHLCTFRTKVCCLVGTFRAELFPMPNKQRVTPTCHISSLTEFEST